MVIDTHVLLWWLEGDPRLSYRAKALLNTAESEGDVYYVSSASFFELQKMEEEGVLRPSQPISQWMSFLSQIRWITVVETSAEIYQELVKFEWQEGDLPDHILAATARVLECPVLTKDPKFHAVESPVAAVW